MSRGAPFKYSLEPVLLTRKWERDGLQSDLARINESMAEAQATIDKIQQAIDTVAKEWKAQAAGSQLLLERFAATTKYVQALATQRLEKEEALALLQSKREELIDLVMAAQRGLEAVERHREEALAEFQKAQMG